MEQPTSQESALGAGLSALYYDEDTYRVQIADRHFIHVWQEDGVWIASYFVLGWNYAYEIH